MIGHGGLWAWVRRVWRWPVLSPIMPRLGAVLGTLGLVLACAALAGAEPTPTNRSLAWDHAGGAAGFYVYAAANVPGHTYSDARRYQIPDGAARSAIVLDLAPTTAGGVCFQVSAYDATGAESAYSNEACGWFGITAPTLLRVVVP